LRMGGETKDAVVVLDGNMKGDRYAEMGHFRKYFFKLKAHLNVYDGGYIAYEHGVWAF
jgi:hypothetical protein